MDEQQHRDLALSAEGSSRRMVLRAIGLGGPATAILAATWATSGRAQEATPPAGAVQPFVGETFVGPTADPNTFVAIVVAEAGEGGREARAYLCNGADVIVWFDQGGVTGEGDGQLDLRSPEGARLAGTLSEDTVAGSVMLPDRASLTFEAPRATGSAGLYTSTVSLGGHVAGVSSEGARLEGQLLVAGVITLPDGKAIPYEWAVAIDDPAELRTIVLGNGGSRGGGRTRKETDLRVAEA